jgi:hypothetical protein
MAFDVAFQSPCELTSEETSSVLKLLNEVCPSGADRHDCFAIALSDGGDAELFAKKIESGCLCSIRNLSPQLNRLLYALLNSANWVLLPICENLVALSARADLKAPLFPEDFPEIIYCSSSEQLASPLLGGFESWARFKNEVVS